MPTDSGTCTLMREYAIFSLMSLTWTRLALEAEEWGQVNHPKARLSKNDPKMHQGS
jgi:hypothetical protein